ncbi:deoxyribonuclease-2-beta-like [Notolabrus celidotus]|uniref:deoxyribonuclease-2-beta-like n=1 Tax=Notolabrus celidotus TaxID=1203425 RepID=UPI0014907C2B|nr:deoxyribonuclease-2-beta-like [Notolabrus celidotus]
MENYIKVMTLFFSAGILFQACDSDVKCKNDNGADVDWYILYKLPQKKGDGGLSYVYMDESTNGWTLSRKKIDNISGSVGNTLKPLFDYYDRKTEGFGYMLYNDQPPPTYIAPASFGHSKGVVLLDRQTGVWLSHSTPKFPTYRSKEFWPSSGTENAQTFMCVTYKYDQFKEIGLQLKYIHAYSYDSVIPTTFYNELQCVAQRSCFPNKAPWFHKTELTSVGGSNFTSFAKYTRFKDDLYSGLLVFHLNQNLYVKSWGKMKAPLSSNCSLSIPYHVYNVKSINLTGQSFTNTADHSKWCVTAGEGWTCIADMNREESQMKRGGGAICTDNIAVWEAFYNLKSDCEKCKHPPSYAETREL